MSSSTYCAQCKKYFASTYNLKRHRLAFHPASQEMSQSSENVDDRSEKSSTTSDVESHSESTESSDNEDTALFNYYDKKLVKTIQNILDSEHTPYELFSRLMKFYHCLKRSNLYKAITTCIENLKTEHLYMSHSEAIRIALSNRKYLVSKLFDVVETKEINKGAPLFPTGDE